MKTTKIFITLAAAATMAFNAAAAEGPAELSKREFRGAWLHTVYQGQYKSQTTEQNKAYLTRQLDSLKAVGVNAVLFQVRPQADAFYPSDLEPWSCYLTDGGKAPVPFWDPLEFMVEQAHARGMELHAWLNPYRVTSSAKQKLAPNHIYHKHPERFVRYDGKLYFDPALPENRDFIGQVVDDIITRYNVDGIHFDDYFYPYPVAGKDFPDDASYAKYGRGMDRGDWRRKNVDLLIEDIHKRIAAKKPWVRFGISPFGIYRNKSTDPKGSDTSGLQNYDALYADVLLWEREGWIDYLLPQLYWELEHKAAGYLVLVDWWNRTAGQHRHLYIGQDVGRTMSKPDLAPSSDRTQLRHKLRLAREGANIQGNCWWPGYSVTRNTGGVADSLANDIQRYPALVPPYTWISSAIPASPAGVTVSGSEITWTPSVQGGLATDVVRYAVYRFDSPEAVDIERADALVDVVPATSFTATAPGCYVVTALDRVNNESAPSVVVRVK